VTGKMFPWINETWNPVKGCLHNCRYCWARSLAEGKLKNTPRYRDGFRPRLNPEELGKRFGKGASVFVSDMGDLFGEWVPGEWISKVLNCIKRSPEAEFLLLTKNPIRFLEFRGEIPGNCVFGATIETNRHYDGVSRAPDWRERWMAMEKLGEDPHRKFISIEPIMDFDTEEILSHVKAIKPCMVAVGYDNYSNRLPEPSLEKVEWLIGELETAGIKVVRKTIRPPNGVRA